MNIQGPSLALAALMGLSVLLRVIAHSDYWIPVAASAVLSVCAAPMLPYIARRNTRGVSHVWGARSDVAGRL